MLDVVDIHTFYGQSQALFGTSLSVSEGEVVSLMGRNGAGKTTTVRSIMGLTPITSGRIHVNGQRCDSMAVHQIARLGIGLVPEGRLITPNLTVKENLIATARAKKDAKSSWTLEKVFQLFPRLKEREGSSGSHLSGGEQQMLVIGRALMTNPNLLILDEATEGLAPLVRNEIMACLQQLKNEGLSILIIDKHIEVLNKLVDRHYLIEKGKITWSGSPEAMSESSQPVYQALSI
ncbi:ABC transporter ATP-binding protein [Vibrio coralliilyticus]|uniref:ABC transporter ATP-binding protein n=1 Tax=Vibrio coralliilyticus TaxID=190893 RepID=A0A837GCZ7_9VIBR|nr:ABC transporter ATP-binding protein [Vibrio coralliilyticus]KJY70959.1 ABC transporter ATP-binding protein [Vibrio coralliilyticus]QOU31060.1 ABC transporter ATP-binding protein [Vibrio coralliilyticus]